MISKEDRELFKIDIEEALKKDIEYRKALIEKYPPNPPNQVCYHAFLRGMPIENSFKPAVNDFIPFFETSYEKIYIWTYRKDTNSGLISEVSPLIKEKPFWKNVGTVLQLAYTFWISFEHPASYDEIDYKWIYCFNPTSTSIDDAVFYNLDVFERHNISNGRILKATDISSMAHIIELLLRDDKAFTSLSLLNSSFNLNYCCLTCELSEHPWHDHLTDEPQIWEQAIFLPQMEAATVQACRCAEGILGEPPNRSKLIKTNLLKTLFF